MKLQYESVFSIPYSDKKIQNAQIFFQNLDESKPQLTDIIFTYSDIEKAIDKLGTNATGGLDGFPVILLKRKKKLQYPNPSMLYGETPWIKATFPY